MEHDFFVILHINLNYTLKMLITNNYVLNKKDISILQKVRFSINNEMTHYEIEIDETRKKYTNEEYDITMIEIKEKDKLDKKSFFDIDNEMFEENLKTYFKICKYFYYIIRKELKWSIQ